MYNYRESYAKSIRTLLLTTVTALCIMTSCGEYELLEHQKICQRKADSTYNANINHLRKEQDSLCEVRYEEMYNTALDSLVPARLEEVKKLISR